MGIHNITRSSRLSLVVSPTTNTNSNNLTMPAEARKVNETWRCLSQGYIYKVFISDMACMFFMELSQKGNTLYNVMPDIISRLSTPDLKLEEEKFKTIMK
jgi:hypothetical protein